MAAPMLHSRIAQLPVAKGLHMGDGGDIPARARWARIQALGQAVRWRDDGTEPTASTGHQLAAGATLEYQGTLSRLSFIQEQATASLVITFYA